MSETEQQAAQDETQAASLAALQAQAAELAPPPLDPAAAEQQAPTVPTVEIVRPVVAIMCAVVCPAWGISGAEQGQLSEVYAAVLDKYFPGGMSMGPELAAVLVTAAIVMPRLGKPRKIEPEKEPEPAEAAPENANQ